eukprot:347507-Pelagomonas_calceolata.AAC.1
MRPCTGTSELQESTVSSNRGSRWQEAHGGHGGKGLGKGKAAIGGCSFTRAVKSERARPKGMQGAEHFEALSTNSILKALLKLSRLQGQSWQQQKGHAAMHDGSKAKSQGLCLEHIQNA